MSPQLAPQPTYRTGRDAIAAWRALPEETRRWCREAVGRDEPLTDVDLASTAAGYGYTMVRRNRWLLVLPAVGIVASALVLLGWTGLFPAASWVAAVPVGLVLLGCVAILAVRTRPHLWYRTLRFWGVTALEKAQLANGPEAEAGDDDGPAEIRFHRARLLAVTVVGWVVVLALSAWAGYRLSTEASLGNVAFVVVCALLVLVLVSDLLRQRQYLVDPAFVRLTAEGWDFPGTDMRGDWSQVLGVEIRSGLGVGWRRFFHPGMRVIVLQVDDGQRVADNARPSRRREAQADHRLYGSPTAFSVGYFFTVGVLDAVGALRRYSPAPISWR